MERYKLHHKKAGVDIERLIITVGVTSLILSTVSGLALIILVILYKITNNDFVLTTAAVDLLCFLVSTSTMVITVLLSAFVEWVKSKV